MLIGSLERASRDFPDTPAFVSPHWGSLSFTQLALSAREVAAGLAARGIGEGSVIALVLPSDLDYVVTYLGAAHLGAVTAGISPLLTRGEASTCLQVVQPDLIVTDTHHKRLIDPEMAALVTLDEHRGGGAQPGGPLRSDSAHGPKPVADDDDRPVCICFTSGTTGAAKGAWFTNRQLQAIADFDTGGAWGGGHGLSSTHFAHVAFMTKLPWMLACGRTTHLMSRWTAGEALELIARHRMNAVAGVAPQIALMVRHPSSRTLDFSAVQAIVAGGAPSPPELVMKARERFGAPYSIRYSSTESGGVGLHTALDADDDEACQSVGRPRQGVEAEIRTPGGETARVGEVGELWLKSPAVMSGYWRNPQATASVIADGWLRTGDLAVKERRGLFRLKGRMSDMYIRGGYNVFPAEVEAALASHEAVAEVAVISQPDPVMGEVGVAVIVPALPSNPPSLQDLRDFATTKLAAYKLPEALRVLDALPRNATGKIDRKQLLD